MHYLQQMKKECNGEDAIVCLCALTAGTGAREGVQCNALCAKYEIAPYPILQF